MGGGDRRRPERGGLKALTHRELRSADRAAAAADGAANAAIARDLAITVDTVAQNGGAASASTAWTACATCREPGGHARRAPQWSPEVKALACERPGE